MNFIGLDPGGQKSFGWATLRIGESGTPVALETGVSSSASNALNEASRSGGAMPIAVGIDAPLFWVMEGDRSADACIRKLVCAAGGHSGTVGHVNSLRGACLVQGILAAHQVANLWPSASVTEAHPKALLRVHPAASDFLELYLPNPPTEHERDAALAAFSAWATVAHFSGWRDLLLDETAPFFPSGHVVSYWFPCQ
ncbi:DUF429 domain-containing protein [Ferribacterium limneticum]|uniref:DUF429 domain-containing protein n=1 Tax=Ferribacterium limneticum TaxID=76259 RepID=UPI001CFB2EE0|nr:DUF429 domain-containing protein [Ferribacterium limneticum]UCV18885.1 DUF429 domain-containing protein [Ferribacterium limneticum]